jgi:UDP-glucose 4-epimerase|tara:strand:- start:694 stop:1641 length:948 start_codon:yes stop_codon:yes gene_type:complete
MKVFVTGGAGFIGLNVVRELIKDGHEVTIFDLPGQVEKTEIPENVKVIIGSILDNVMLHRAIQGNEYIIHLAAKLGVKRTEVERLNCLNVNIKGTENILESAVKENIKKVVFTSSSEVYGNQLETPITEESPVNPISVYAITKLVGEEYLKAYKQEYDLDYSIIRFFNVYGAGQVGQFVIQRFIEAVKRNKSPQIYGDGKQVRCFCHVNDAARGLVKVLFCNNLNNGEVFNIGNDTEPINLEDLAFKIIKIAKKDIEPEFVPYSSSDRNLEREVFNRIPSIEKIKNILDYKPDISLENGLKKSYINHLYTKDWKV